MHDYFWLRQQENVRGKGKNLLEPVVCYGMLRADRSISSGTRCRHHSSRQGRVSSTLDGNCASR